MYANRVVFLDKFEILNKFKKELLNESNYLYIFEDLKSRKNNVFIITGEDEVFVFGGNSYGVLGFGHEKVVNDLSLNKDISHKQIIDIKSSKYQVIARSFDGKVYCWGSDYEEYKTNINKPHKPEINQYLKEEHVIDISCGYNHFLALTKKGILFTWGHNYYGQTGNNSFSIQFKPERFGLSEDKFIMISCGGWHSMALTESGRVYSWGRNNEGQLANGNTYNVNIPQLVKEKIRKISCGSEHSLLLSNDGEIHVFGNDGSQRQNKLKNSLINSNYFVDIESHYNYKISIALSKNGIFYIWGLINGEIFKRLRETKFSSFIEIFHFYYDITHKTIRMRKPRNDIKLKGLNHFKEKYEEDFIELDIISFGNYGVVCKATDKLTNEIFGIKKIPLLLSEINSGSFYREVQLMNKMPNNDYIVHYREAWIENNYFAERSFDFYKDFVIKPDHQVFDKNKPFLLHIQMEFCYKTLKQVMNLLNEELYEKVADIKFSIGYYVASEIFKEILEGVGFLHKQNPPIIHRDLKPANILFTNGLNGKFVKIADFGLATFHKFKGESHTKHKRTLKYMAFEVNQSKYYGIEADVYSLGVIALELFNLDINEKPDIVTNRILRKKQNELHKILLKMLDQRIRSRPTCGDILKKEKNWAFDSFQLLRIEHMENYLKRIDSSFHLEFCRKKLNTELNYPRKMVYKQIESRDGKNFSQYEVDGKKWRSRLFWTPRSRLIFTGNMLYKQIESRDEKKISQHKDNEKKKSLNENFLASYANSLSVGEGASQNKLLNLTSDSCYIDSAIFRKGRARTPRMSSSELDQMLKILSRESNTWKYSKNMDVRENFRPTRRGPNPWHILNYPRPGSK